MLVLATTYCKKAAARSTNALCCFLFSAQWHACSSIVVKYVSSRCGFESPVVVLGNFLFNNEFSMCSNSCTRVIVGMLSNKSSFLVDVVDPRPMKEDNCVTQAFYTPGASVFSFGKYPYAFRFQCHQQLVQHPSLRHAPAKDWILESQDHFQ